MGSFPDGVYRAQFPYYYRNPEGMPQEAALDYYLNSIKDVFEQCGPADSIAAIVVQPLQGEGGFIPAPIEWVKAVRKICDENGILLVADEVQTGFCRTGRMFATQYWEEAGVQPDILATAKSIAAALKTIEIMERDDLAGRSCEIGEKVSKRFNEWKEKYPVIGDVRGLGGMIGLEFVKDQKSKEPYPEFSAAVISGCAKKGLMIEHIVVKDFTKCLILRMRSVPALDSTALNALKDLVDTCEKKGITIVFSHVNEQPMKVMKKAGFIELVGKEHFCPNIAAALKHAEDCID